MQGTRGEDNSADQNRSAEGDSIVVWRVESPFPPGLQPFSLSLSLFSLSLVLCDISVTALMKEIWLKAELEDRCGWPHEDLPYASCCCTCISSLSFAWSLGLY